MKLSFRSMQLHFVVFFTLVHFSLGNAFSQTFASTGNLDLPLEYQTSTLLQDGTVLIAGGLNDAGITKTAELYNAHGSPNAFSPTGAMNVARYSATATLLGNGQVLVAGGTNLVAGINSSAELYDPVAGQFNLTVGSMIITRYNATATLLQDGTVLIAGGDIGNSQGLTSAEIYNPTTKSFAATQGSMTTRRTNHTATLLSDGTVLIAGGQGNYSGQKAWQSAEIYNPANQLFTAVGNMTVARSSQTATLLTDGTVLIAGGENSSGNGQSTAEIYSPLTQSFSVTGSMHASRYFHVAAPLEDGTVLIAGGISSESSNTTLNSAEVYTPSLRTFAVTGNLTTPRESATATLLNNGEVLVAGGDSGFGGSGTEFLSSAELYSYPFTSGAMTPKYIVLGVLYSPPGAKSSVTYTQSTALGTSSQVTNTEGTSTNISSSLGITGGNKSVMGSGSETVSQTWTQQADSSSTYTVNKTTTAALQAAGPLSSTIGVDHDYDVILVWVNPKVNISVGAITTNLLWNGYSYDSRDPYFSNDLDVVQLPIYCLKNPFLAPDCTDNNPRTSRSWDTTSGLGGLTLADYQEIAARDPFYTNPSYDPNNDSTNRFTFTGQSVNYDPAPPGDGAITSSGSLNYQVIASAGQDASDSYKVSYTVDASLKSIITADFKDTQTTMWANKWSETQTDTAGQTAAYSITGPLATDNYTGPTGFEVWQDNVYGTFMFVASGTTPTSSGSIDVSPANTATTPITFTPAVPVGSASSPVQVTLTNNSSMPMFMGVSSAFPFLPTSTALSPVAAFSDPGFSVVTGTDTCSGKIIAANGTCTISVVFSPTASDVPGSGGVITGTMYLTGETDAVVSATASLSGTVGTATSTISLSPSSLTFPSTAVGSTSAAQTITATNTGTTALSLSSYALIGANASSFLISGNTCSTSLAVGANCTLSVAFRPTADGALTASLAVTDSASGSPQTVALTGTGTGTSGTSTISLSPSSLAFPPTAVGGTSVAQTITVTNTGTTALTVSSYSFNGANASSFLITAKTCLTSLAVGASCTLSIAFDPTADGALTASLAATDSASGSPQTVALSGTGGISTISLSPSSLAFPPTAVGGTSAAQTITVTNTGTTALTVSSYTFTGANASSFLITTKTCSTSLAVGANCTLSVAFRPTANGAMTASLAATDSASGSPQTVALTGTGGTSTISFSPSSLVFPSTAVGGTSAAQTITVTNTGTTALTVSSYMFTGANASSFLLPSKTCSTSLAVGASCTLSVTFSPTADGALTANLAATDSATGSPQTVGLSGTGATP
jgi:Abnormal spindle-like microcephaly-assoc'd, ASPM-SPD-2-Hydin